MIELLPIVSLSEIQLQRECYMNELLYSQELNTEENAQESKYYKIKLDSIWIGYFCVDSKKTLWEFYIIKSDLIHSQEVFKFLIDMNYIVSAECITYDHMLMSLCFDFQKKSSCSAYVFRDDIDVKYSLSTYEDISMRVAMAEDFNSLLEINRIAEGWNDFFSNLSEQIRMKEVFVFYADNELLGAGTCKKTWQSRNYCDIGMVVSDKHRNKGVGTYIILKLKEYCYSNNQIPICGCWYPNYPSKKTLEKAGFIAKHRVIRFEF
jgi:GNAT superfamily N-acetyltransferase